jgi:phage gp45-like
MIRAILQSITETAGKVRRFVASGRVRETVRNGALYQHYGFTSKPPAGARCIVFGNSGIEASVAEDYPAGRPDIDALGGAACLWQDAGHYVLIKADGSVVIKTDQAVTVESGDIRLGSGVELLIKKMVTQEFLTAYNVHIHPDPVSGVSGEPTVKLVGPAAEAVITQKTRSA